MISAAVTPYPEMKASGVAWIGDVPNHWNVCRTKSLLLRNESGVWGSDFDDQGIIVLRSTEQTANGEWNLLAPARRRLSPSEYAACRLDVGDLLVTKSSGSQFHIGKTTIVTRQVADLDCCFSNFMQRLRVNGKARPRFLWYALNGIVGRSQLDYYSDTTTGLANLNSEIIGNVTLAVPPSYEQDSIIRFLDHADRRIQRYIRAKQQLIALLEEHKQAIIHQAVTGQIDVRTGRPYSLYRPSGTDALGRIPKDWDVLPLAAVGTHKSITGKPSLELLSVYLVRGVIPFSEERGKRTNVTSEDRSKYQEVLPGDFVLNNQQAWRGSVGVSRYHGIVSPAYLVLTISDSMHSEFADLIFRARVMVAQYVACSRGVGTIQRNIYWPHLKRVVIPFPPRSEQIRIADYLREIGNGFTTTAARMRREIELMKELRNCLIAVSVTGKIDVRNMAGLC